MTLTVFLYIYTEQRCPNSKRCIGIPLVRLGKNHKKSQSEWSTFFRNDCWTWHRFT